MTTFSPTNKKQAFMEDYLGSPRSGGKCGGQPPPPPFEEVKGSWVVKDFVANRKTREVRPFRGQVTRYFKSDGSYEVVYEDDDREDLDWTDLWPLLQRAKAEGVTGPSQPAKKRGRPPKQQQQQQQRRQDPQQQQGAQPPAVAQQQEPGQQQQQQGPALPAAAAAAATAASSPTSRGGKRKQEGGQEGSSSAKKSAKTSNARTAGAAAADGASAVPKAAGAAGATAGAAVGVVAAAPRPDGTAASKSVQVPAPKIVSGKQPQKASDKPKAPAAVAAGRSTAAPMAAGGSAPAAGAAGTTTSQPAFRPTARKTVAGKGAAAWSGGKEEGPPAAATAAAALCRGGGAAAAAAAAANGGAAARGKEKKPRAPREPSEPVPQLPLPDKEKEYTYARGKEPWRSLPHFCYMVHDELDNSAAAVARIRAAQKTFNKHLIQAEVDEEERVTQRIAELKAMGRKGAAEKRPSKRPDRVAESCTKAEGSHIGGKRVVGYLPGWPVGSRAYCRSELSCINFHRMPVAGIDFLAAEKAGKGVPSFATSVMVSGWYQDDKDDAETIWYTGEGGNDLLHTRQQVADQQLKRGNKALAGNIALGLPVRVTRKQKSSAYPYGACYVFDGLYDVIRWRLHKGKNGKNVFQFQLRRRPGQGELVSQRVEWGAISAPRKLEPKNRQGVVDLDISRGQEAQPIPAIDDTWLTQGNEHEPQGCVPPCTALEDIVGEKVLVGKTMRGVNQERIEQLRAAGYRPSVQYITNYHYTGKAAEMAKSFKAAQLPAELRTSPHEHLRKLNHGKLPYSANGQLFSVRPVVYECCPNWQCPDGDACPYRLTQRPSKYRVEVFQTGHCGWGVRTLDTIPQYAFVMLYVGEVYEREEHEHLVRTVEEQDTEYTMDMCPRPDVNWDGSNKTAEEAADHPAPGFVCCGLRKRNVGAFVNHSCQPNLFVQPVLTTHHDDRCCGIALFSMENIAPLTELTIDYGQAYVSGWPGGCRCGAVNCVSKRAADAAAGAAAASKQQQQQQQQQNEGDGNGDDSGDDEEEGEGKEEGGSDEE